MTGSRPRLPESVGALIDGRHLTSKVGYTILLATAGQDARPHLAMLSVGEVLAPSADTVHLALHRNTGSAQALTTNGQGLLSLVIDGAAYQVSLNAERADHLDETRPGTAYFRAAVTDIRKDDVPYAVITSGVSFQLTGPDETLPRWEAQLDALRQL